MYVVVTNTCENMELSNLYKNHDEVPMSLKKELPHNKTNKISCASSEDSDRPGHPPSLIRVFAVCSMGS